MEAVVRGYGSAASTLFESYDAIDPERLYAPVIDLFPSEPTAFADLGAGTGRDAAWLAAGGHDVTAVEPVAAFRAGGMARHRAWPIRWCDDRLPALGTLPRSLFGGVLVSGVWQHLTAAEQATAAVTVGAIAAPGAVVILSLRHGPGAAERPVIAINPDRTIAAAQVGGLALRRRIEADSIGAANRQAGVRWTWLAFERR